MKLSNTASLLLVCAGLSGYSVAQTDTSPLTLTDIMHFETLAKPVLSENGLVLAVEAEPDRGDSRTIVRHLAAEKSFDLIGASKPMVSPNGRFVAMTKAVSLLEQETLDEKSKKKLKAGLILLDTQTGKERLFERVKSAEFSHSGSHLAIVFEADEPSKEDKAAKEDTAKAEKGAEQTAAEKKAKVDKFDQGSRVSLIALHAEQRLDFEHVTRFAFDNTNQHFAVAVNDTENKKHQVILVSLADNAQSVLFSSTTEQIGELALSDNGLWLAMTKGNVAELPYGREYDLNLIHLQTRKLKSAPSDKDWQLNRYSRLRFTQDSERLFFGRVPEVSQQLSLPKVDGLGALYDIETISAQRGLRVWHGEDPLIKPNEIKQYDKMLEATYLAVLHVNSNNVVQLADKDVPEVAIGEQRRFLLASSDIPYQKMITWAGFYKDYYVVDINTGNKVQIISQQPSDQEPTWSANGKFVAYYQQGQVYLYDVANARRYHLTKNLAVSFADEDHDYPSAPPGYGFGPWVEQGDAILVYDKYDVWQFDTQTRQGINLTLGQGRKQQVQYRVTGLYEDKDTPVSLSRNETVLLQGYNERTKADGFYQAKVGAAGVTTLMEGDYKLTVLGRSKAAKTFAYSKERYDRYPDIYTADYLSPQTANRQTDFDAQKNAFGWGKAELVHWTNGDGKPLDGVLIKPANYQAGQQYPVLVYFYRFMSDRLHAFPQMKINHRPNFAWYANNGYAIFLPDIRFEVGYPGATSVQALTSGVQKLIEMGVADPDAIGIQGHSWGGYQTAFAVTQTHIFKAAVTGAPVANMTSAYSGIRHGSGLARQFQYETGQSRIGESLFAAPQKYIENSPVFYAERIQTPMMIMFGDKDDAVPWEQGVELYLAMRRAGKDVVFLQYQDEPHHLKKYPNKLDYTVRMKAYFDHYLKGAPAPAWITSGEAYQEFRKED